ncbi:MAG: hypothetical protein AB2A00_04895 [Myxococcota bacterium]
MNRIKLGLGVSLLSLLTTGCWIFTTFPLDGTNGMQGEYGGLIKRVLKGRETTFLGGGTASQQHDTEEERDLVIIIEDNDEGGAVVFGLECDLPVSVQGPQELKLGGDVTCTRRTRDEVTQTGGTIVQTELVQTYTFSDLTVTKTGQPREITLEASGNYLEVTFSNGSKVREYNADFEYSYEGTRISAE